jgi:two-component system response regulator AtoC
MKPILIVDNEEKFCKIVKTSLELEDLKAEYVTSGEAAEKWLDNQEADIIITDLRMDGMDGLELLKRIKFKSPSIDVLMMTAFASQKTAVEALKEGALDYLIKPFEMDELVLRVKRTLQQKKIMEENRQLRTQVEKPVYFDKIIGRSEAMKRVYQLIQKAAQSTSTVIILGESGTGKELVAETVHSHSDRSDQQFMAINCAAVPENLLESELFGHEKGAFTGAFQKKIGKFENAKNGTIFLDEIGDMSLAIQAKLLRVLQNKEIFRLGGNEKIKINTRIIAATNRDLESMVESKAFREDLFYRLNVFPINLPPLRERKEDIPELVNHFIKSHDIVAIDREALKELMEHDWPGNIRELQNVLERASIMAESIIKKDDLPKLKADKVSDTLDWDLPEAGFQLDEFEKFLIERALFKANGNKSRAAEILGITRRRLYSMMKSMGFNLSL